MRRVTLLVCLVCVIGCSKTSTSTPESTGSSTPTTGSATAKPAADAGTTAATAGSGSGSGSGSAVSGDVFDRSIAQLEALKTRMCACKDTTCSATTFDEYKAWRMEMRRAIAGKKPTKPQEDRGNELDKELTNCRKNVDSGVTNIPAGSGSGGALDAALVEYEGFKTKMCACKDKACSDKVQEDIKTWDRMMRANIKDKPNSAQQLRGKAIEKQISECRKAAETATPGAADSGPKIEAMLTKLGGFKDKVCACKDKACLEAVDKEMTAWMTEAAKGLADAKPTKDQDAKADKLQADMKACVSKIH